MRIYGAMREIEEMMSTKEDEESTLYMLEGLSIRMRTNEGERSGQTITCP